MKRWVVTLLAASSISACTTEAQDLCKTPEATIEALFLGDAFGRGTITVGRSEGGLFGRAELTSMEGRASTDAPMLKLAGPALCRDGIVKVELGAGSTDDGELKVLGGEVHVVLARAGLVDRPFGTWQAQILQGTWKAPKTMGGPWTESPTQGVVASR